MVVIDEIEDGEPLSPPVLWAQRKETISLKVNISEPKDPKIKMTQNSFTLEVKGKGAKGYNFYKFQLQFFKPVDVESCTYKLTPSHVDIQLTKEGEGEWWPRLLPENVKKPHYLKLDFDRWKSESDDEDEKNEEDVQLEELKKAFETGRAKHESVTFFKNFYLFLYNCIQLVIFIAITFSCMLGYIFRGREFQTRTYQFIGSMVTFGVLLSYLETVHAKLGLVKTAWFVSLLQTSGRGIVVLCLWLGGKVVQNSVIVWALFMAWSMADTIRYPVYMMQIVKKEIPLFTWIRYHAWIVLYPIGGYCEYRVLTDTAVMFEEYDLYNYTINSLSLTLRFSTFLRAYVLAMVVGITLMMRYMWKLRSYKYGNRRKFKPA